MRKLWMVGVVVVFTVGIHLGWKWVNRIPNPEEFQPNQQDASAFKAERSSPAVRNTIRIAVITPPKKAIPDEGPSLAAPARFCVDRVNSYGGIKGLPVELVILESENSALDSAGAARQAVESGVVAVIGGYSSSGALAAAEILQSARIPFIAVGATNPDVTTIGDYVFRINFIDSFQGAAMADFAYVELGARTAAVLVNVGNRYSPYLSEVFSEQFKQLGGTLSWQRDYLPGPGGYGRVFADLPIPQPDVIFVPGYEDDSAAIIRDARAAGIQSTFLGADGWGAAMFDYAGDAVNGGFYTKAYHPDAGLSEGLREVLDSWIEQHGPIRRDSIPQTIDACYLLFSALDRAQQLTPDGVREALAKTDGFRGALGSYTFNFTRDPEKPLTVLRLDRPAPVLVKVVEPKTVKLGILLARTGEASQVNALGFQAARYAAEEINRMGGVLARRLELIEYDNESTVLGARKAAGQAVHDGVSAVVGASWSSHSLAIASILQSARIPMVTPTATNPSVTRMGDFIFRACYSDELQGKLLAEFALGQLKAKTAVILTNVSSEYSLGLGRLFSERFVKEGQVVLETDYMQSATDFRAILEKVQAANPDVIFVPSYPRDSAYIIRQARQMGIQATFVGADGWDELMYEYTHGELEGSYHSEHWHPEVPDEKSRAFVERYSAKHKVFRAGLFALTYDSVHLIADAIRRAGSFKAEDIRTALARTTDFHGITGRIQFDENRDPLTKPLVILRFGKEASVFHVLVLPNARVESRE
ncbi:MAG: ABC transporter substrate-binding protein [Syntrophobacteraceae bacterium]